jgi:tetratricopeptide (TPR) repeat protein
MHNLGMAYKENGQLNQAITVLEDALAKRNTKLGADHLQTSDTRIGLALALQANKQPTKAEPLLRENLEIQGKKDPDSWTAFNAASLLGDVLLDLTKYAEAEPFLLRGYEGLKQRMDKIPANHKLRVAEALERLVRLYDAWGKKEQAEQWRNRKE